MKEEWKQKNSSIYTFDIDGIEAKDFWVRVEKPFWSIYVTDQSCGDRFFHLEIAQKAALAMYYGDYKTKWEKIQEEDRFSDFTDWEKIDIYNRKVHNGYIILISDGDYYPFYQIYTHFPYPVEKRGLANYYQKKCDGTVDSQEEAREICMFICNYKK